MLKFYNHLFTSFHLPRLKTEQGFTITNAELFDV
jgi:hypothetical protein